MEKELHNIHTRILEQRINSKNNNDEELEALKIGIPKLKKLYENSAKKMNKNDILGFDLTFVYLDKVLAELKAIKEANPNEATKCLESLRKSANTFCQHLPEQCELNKKYADTIKQALLKAQEQKKENAECVGGRSFNKEVIYLKQSIERCNDKPIFYFSKRYGNKYIVPQEEYEKLNNENAKLQNKCQEQEKVLEIINKKSVYIHLLQQCGDVESYNNYFITKYGLDEFTERLLLTQEEFDLLKR